MLACSFINNNATTNRQLQSGSSFPSLSLPSDWVHVAQFLSTDAVDMAGSSSCAVAHSPLPSLLSHLFPRQIARGVQVLGLLQMPKMGCPLTAPPEQQLLPPSFFLSSLDPQFFRYLARAVPRTVVD